MRDLSNETYTNDQVIKMLTGSRRIRHRYELLDKSNLSLGYVTATGTIDYDSDATIKACATFNIKEIKDINVIDERIRPIFGLWTPTGWIEYPLGVFILSSPTKYSDGIKLSRECDAYDKTVILREDKLTNRLFIQKGTPYTDAVISVLSSAGITSYNLTASDLITSQDLEFEIGTQKIEVINALLKAINYYDLYFDENGTATAKPYESAILRQAEYSYETNSKSIIKNTGYSETLDVFNAPNVIVRYVSSPEAGELVASYTNDDPQSILSTVSRGRNIVSCESVNDIADQATLNAYVAREYAESQVYGQVEFTTALMPHHWFRNCLNVKIDRLGVYSRYIETGWRMELQTGGNMVHKCKKVVPV